MTLDYQKVWNTMNELEMVTSKICSAREIIDAAIDRIQEHQYDKAETMMSAAHEFLGVIKMTHLQNVKVPGMIFGKNQRIK